jgi:hypothetical protein
VAVLGGPRRTVFDAPLVCSTLSAAAVLSASSSLSRPARTDPRAAMASHSVALQRGDGLTHGGLASFTPQDVDSIEAAFRAADANKDGVISLGELKEAFRQSGRDLTTAEVEAILKIADKVRRRVSNVCVFHGGVVVLVLVCWCAYLVVVGVVCCRAAVLLCAAGVVCCWSGVLCAGGVTHDDTMPGPVRRPGHSRVP